MSYLHDQPAAHAALPEPAHPLDRPARKRPHVRTLRAVGRMLGYPDAALRTALPALCRTLWEEAALSAIRLRGLKRLADELLADPDGLQAEAGYVDLFDRGRSTSLHLFEHVHGDSRSRGPAMVDLQQTYEAAGLSLEPGELPDYLPAVLEFASTQPAQEARAFLGELAHILNALHTALERRGSAYAEAVAAVLEIAGEPLAETDPAPEPDIDAAWAEPEAFGGCSSAGQQAPQPIHIVRPNRDAGARQQGGRP